MESIGRLAGGVAHDFNNMLGAILGHVEFAVEELEAESPVRDDLAEIRRAAERSAELTRQLLAFARKQTVSPKVLDLNQIVAGMLRMLQRLLGEDIELEWRPSARLWSIQADPSQLDQILANLCVNARDAIKDVGKITIETDNKSFDAEYCATHAGCTAGNYVLLAVSDDGCGMNKDVQAHLFEPFFTTKGVGKGTGIGLATVYGIVKQNEGFIGVYSEPGHGTTFRIYLPSCADAVSPSRAPEARAPQGGNETILVVEDEAAILGLTTRILKQLGYEVLTASSPLMALNVVEGHQGPIHLLLTDVVMPEMNGRDLAARLLVLHPAMRQLYMSGYTANVIAHHGVLDSRLQFLQKPFSSRELADAVRRAMDEVAAPVG
jgi:two-component system, cell cycle sensor histidine kinase and response regulator CckA